MNAPTQHAVSATIANDVLSDQDIQALELARARRTLEILKTKLGGVALQSLMQPEIDLATAQSEKWADQSDGKWQSGFVVLNLPGVKATAFHAFIMNMIERGDEVAMREAHPDHLLNRILAAGPEVIENLGEDMYSWHFFGKMGPIDATIPLNADAAYPIGFALQVKSVNNKTIAFAVHELRDHDDGMQAKLSIVLPGAAPDRLIRGHLNHFSVEFRNWYRAMVSAS